MDDRIAKIEAIKARLSAATPGPWRWWGNVDTRQIQLTTVGRGVMTIMAFQRWGMQRAAPAFFRRTPDMPYGWNGKQESVGDIAVREVPYRGDLVRLNNPNAELIAHAPSDIEFLLGEVDRLRAELNTARAETEEVIHDYAFGLVGADEEGGDDR